MGKIIVWCIWALNRKLKAKRSQDTITSIVTWHMIDNQGIMASILTVGKDFSLQSF